ncbi:TonB-dependent receptor [Hyphomicrobium sp.]|uniref:TonB-dependent receptor n=1 Tax=Hyphomicrobium sp. TaxID=82 RepID=UPI0025C16E8A|nr:TonB-dependent receptor [Hyphomicrobium sp.]MCC7253380.1 TonB-dependent receptor [Hyphomicrobium sp.]
MRIAAIFALLIFGGPAAAQQPTETPPPKTAPAADALTVKPAEPAPSSSQTLPPLDVVTTQPKKKTAAKKKSAQPSPAAKAPAATPAGSDAGMDRAAGSPSAVASELRDSTTGTSTVSATDVARSGESTVYDVLKSLPNVTPAPSGPTIPAVRGESATPTNLFSNFYQGTTSRIVLSVDDIPRISSYANNSFQSLYDVSSLQVLRGPQHTLPGTNAFAGAYVVETNDPVFSYSAGALTEFTYNEYSGMNYRNAAFANVPFSNEAAMRLVVEFDKGEIPVDIVGPASSKLDDYDGLNLRGKFLVEPDSIPGLSVLVSAEYGNGLDHVFNNYVDVLPFSDRKRSASDFRISDTEGWAAGVRARYELSAREEIASITSYVHDQYSSSPRSTSAFKFDDMAEERFAQDLTYSFRDVANLTGVIGVGLTDGARLYDANAYIAPSLFTPAFMAFGKTDADIATQSAYADIAWNFAGPFDLLFGGRIERYDDKRELFADLQLLNGTSLGSVSRNYDVDEVYVLPKIGVRYNLRSSESIAFTVRKGYNPGGAYVNLQAQGFPFEEYKAEEVWTYEAAYRTVMMNNRLQLGITAFYNDYKDKQFAITTQPGSVVHIYNQPDAESYGLEFEGKYAVTPDFDVIGGFGLLHTEINEISAGTAAAILGNDFGQDPSYSVSLGVAWRPVENLELTARGVYVDDYFTDFVNFPLNVAGGYTLIDIGASYQVGNATARVFVNNLTDETALSTLILNPGPNATLLDPRTFGASLDLKF